MEKFLKSIGCTVEQIKEIRDMYITKDHKDATALPEFIGKVRLDEEIGKKKGFETKVTELTTKIETFETGKQKEIDDAVKVAKDEAKTHEDAAIKALKDDFDITEAIYGAKGRNVKAIKALVDTSKPVADEIASLQKSDPYLFSTEEDLPGGTGKKGVGDGKDKDKDLEIMRGAVGGL